MAAGVEARVPFCDHQLVEYVWGLPWQLLAAGQPKSILRSVGARRLPRPVVERAKSGFPATTDPAYESGLRAEAREVLADSGSPVLPLIDRRAAQGMVRGQVSARSTQADRAALEFMLMLNRSLLIEPARLAM
jgi:asparagine synthetase B (glutamine-hydrolysing)